MIWAAFIFKIVKAANDVQNFFWFLFAVEGCCTAGIPQGSWVEFDFYGVNVFQFL